MKYAVIVLGVIFLNCNSNVKNIHSVRCHEEFDIFIEKFKTDSVYQREHMQFPVDYWYSDEDFPLDMMFRAIDEEDYEFIDLNEYNNVPTQMEHVIFKVNDTVFYDRKGIDRYVNVTHKFLCVDGEWKLVEVVDNTD